MCSELVQGLKACDVNVTKVTHVLTSVLFSCALCADLVLELTKRRLRILLNRKGISGDLFVPKLPMKLAWAPRATR